MSMYPTNDNIYNVSQLNSDVRLLLENGMGIVWLIGEMSNFSMPISGHWYFTLKDCDAQIKCVMFRGNNNRVMFTPTNGNQVLVRARISFYEPRGNFQIIAESMQQEGDGLLQQQFKKLKSQLTSEGLLTKEIKRSLPRQPRKIGIVTSKTGAALPDILNVLKRRDPTLSVIIYPTKVQGKDAAIQIAQAIRHANSRNECDVLIVGRGGGSLEDLWAFNEEIVARTIAASIIPVVSAVGHEVDFTISDFVADVRAPTPSAAAELVSHDISLRIQQLSQRTDRLAHTFTTHISHYIIKLTHLVHRLAMRNPRVQLRQQTQQFDELERRICKSISQKLQSNREHLNHSIQRIKRYSSSNQIPQLKTQLGYSERRLIDAIPNQLRQQQHALALQVKTLNAISPLTTLVRGYSITCNQNGRILKSCKDISVGEVITTSLSDGEIQSEILWENPSK